VKYDLNVVPPSVENSSRTSMEFPTSSRSLWFGIVTTIAALDSPAGQITLGVETVPCRTAFGIVIWAMSLLYGARK
jgi:hypothetical protein